MKQKFYTVKMEFLVEAETKEEAQRKVTEHNFTKVMERENGWHNFEVLKSKRVKESELV